MELLDYLESRKEELEQELDLAADENNGPLGMRLVYQIEEIEKLISRLQISEAVLEPQNQPGGNIPPDALKVRGITEEINQALHSGTVLQIVYKDYYGRVTTRRITPIVWEMPNLVRAFCHLRQAERHFRITNIISYSKISPDELHYK